MSLLREFAIGVAQSIFGCLHLHMSRVWNIPALKRGAYRVCLDCGAEFEYHLATMRQGKKISRRAERPDMVTLQREIEEGRELPPVTTQRREA